MKPIALSAALLAAAGTVFAQSSEALATKEAKPAFTGDKSRSDDGYRGIWFTLGQFSKTEQCMTTELPVPIQTWDTYRDFAEGMKSAMASMGPMGKGIADMAAKMKEMRGFPLSSTTTSSFMGRSSSTSSEVVEVKKGAIPASAWEVPAGYRRIDNPMLKAMAPGR